jgi:tyrosyl-tRNA synthetase
LHGETGLAAAERATRALFGGDIEGLGADDIADVFADVPSSVIVADELGGDGKAVVDLLVESGLASSKGDARRAIDGGGVYMNNARVEDAAAMVTMSDTIEGRFLLLRKGKKSYHLIAVSV